MNTARWDAWVSMVKQSDATLVQLATMAAAAVLIWESMRQVPDRWRELARSAYLVGLLFVFLKLMGGMMDTTAYTVGVTIVTFVVGGALAVWWTVHRAQGQSATQRDIDARLATLAKTQPAHAAGQEVK